MLKELGYNANMFDEASFFDGDGAKAYCELYCQTCVQNCSWGCEASCVDLCIVGCKVTGMAYPCVLMF